MKIIYRFSIQSILLLTFAGNMFAQNTTTKTHRVFYGDIGLELGIPMKEFADSTNAIGFGFGGGVMYQPSNKVPLLIGGDLGFLVYGSNTQRQTLYANITAGTTIIDQLSMPLKFETTNSMFNMHLRMRLQAPTTIIRPYVDGVAGFNSMFTSTSLYDESEQHYFSTADDPLITSSTESADVTYQIGYGGGILIDLVDNLHLNLQANYLYGGNISYFDANKTDNWDISLSSTSLSSPSNLSSSDLNFNAVPTTSKSDMLLFLLSVSFDF